MSIAGSFLDVDTFTRLLTFAVFVVAGMDLSRIVPQSKHPVAWSLFAAITVAGGYVAWRFPTVTLLGFAIFLDSIVVGLWSGFVAGLLIRWYPKFRMR
ncbi:MAG TPA: hypothetical protein VMM37_08130 [Bacteroidota bacterium]|nr:hypothetical protein [Bacteroidota bacterium]